MANVRLVNANDVYLASVPAVTWTGPLQIFHKGQWRHVCSTANFNRQNAQLACKQLGLAFENGIVANNTPIVGGEWVSQISCGENTNHLGQCVPEKDSLSCPGAQAKQIQCGSEDPTLKGDWNLKMVTPDRVFSHGVKGRLEVR